ncbi:MAG: ABC transporter ATP-binding protein [Kiritimatiellaeota bacterium]|nr:ABC transporter ATP-binding protein [Kiritimatiellota bacterium]
MILEVRDLRVRYGHIEAVQGISFEVRTGEIVALVGANGAGKSSTLRAISGVLPFSGEILFEGQPIHRLGSAAIVARGIAQVPEGRGIFGNLTVQENLKLATWNRRDRRAVKDDLRHVFDLFPRLAERRQQLGGTLSGGEQQMLAIARALMTRAKLLLLDEPSMGLAPMLVREIFRILQDINQAGTSLLLVEQNALMALKVASHGYVLETGHIVMHGTGRELADHPRVKEAYLG